MSLRPVRPTPASRRSLLLSALVAAVAAVAATVAGLPAVPAVADPRVHLPAGQAAASTAGDTQLLRDSTGRVRLLAGRDGRTLPAGPAVASARGPVAVARAHLERYAGSFGVRDPRTELRADRVVAAPGGTDVVRFQQVLGGIPVLGGQLVAVLDGRRLRSVSGETTQVVASSSYRLGAGVAARVAARATARAHGRRPAAVHAERPTRWLYDPSLLDRRQLPGARAVWRVESTLPGRDDVREMVLVDAGSGAVALRFNQVPALDRVICDNANTPTEDFDCGPGRYVRVEGAPATGVPDVDQSYDLTGATSDWYARRLGVDLTALIGSDYGDGAKIRSITRYCEPDGCPFDNAFWSGEQMVYGAGYTSADDVVAHELAHGATDRTAGLLYWFQSGAINESMSDVLGELVDLENAVGTDTAETRWQLGEDLPAAAGGVARDMAAPPAHGQPDRTTSPLYELAPEYQDNGGVHTNSGVPNKTAYLIADGTVAEPGGAFGGASFLGIGVEKTAVLYWSALQLLTPGSDFVDLAAALSQTCATLAATAAAGVTAADCQIVSQATAVTGLTRWSGPSEPRGVTMIGGVRAVRLSWLPPATSGSTPVSSYIVHVSPAVQGEDFVALEPETDSWVVDELRPGVTYTVSLLAVTAEGASPAVSRTFSGTVLTASVPGSVVRGQSVRVTGTLLGPAGEPAGGRPVVLLRREPASSAHVQVATTTTGADGTFAFRHRPRQSTGYAVSFRGAPAEVGARSRTVPTAVRPRVTARVADATVEAGQRVVFRGSVTPAAAAERVVLQRRAGEAGRWSRVARGEVARSDGRYRVSGRAPAASVAATVWRVVARTGTAKLADGLSHEVLVRVR